jgi:tRNA G10  N-methylase Trm11
VELKLADLAKNVMKVGEGKTKGLDVVVDGSLDQILFGYTEFLSEVNGFYDRDFQRPYQDPTVTISPRLARVLVNLCGLPRGKTVLDPFCGLGTVLQEALILGYNVVGLEISSTMSARCRENINWLRGRFQVSPKLSSNVIRADAINLERSDMPTVDAIATEPILMPKLDANPTSNKSEEILRIVRQRYSDAFRAFSWFLPSNGTVSIVVPELVDDRGRSHSFDLEQIGRQYGFIPTRFKESFLENPCQVPTAKRKMIRRKVYLMKKEETRDA